MDDNPETMVEDGPARMPRVPSWDAVAAISFGWRAVTADLTIVLHLFLAQLAANALVIVAVVAAVAAGLRKDDLQFVRAAAQIANIPIAIWIGMGIVRYVLRRVRGQEAAFGDIFTGGPFWSYLGGALAAGLLTLVGIVFCIVPGVILALGLQFFGQEIIDRHRPAIESLKSSWALTNGHKMTLFVFALLAFLVNLAGALACGVGVILTSALTTVASSWIYLRLRGETPPEPGLARATQAS